MKKQIAAVFAAALIVVGLAACESGDAAETGGSRSTMADKSESDPDSGEAEDKNAEKVRYIYGETEIPDIPCGDSGYEGKADIMQNRDNLQQSLDCMVFETHTSGDYTIKLVGDYVRTDEANFPGSIYTQNLRVEIEENGTKVEEDGRYNDTVLYVAQVMTEYRIFSERIGSYLDIYDLEYPVIAMRYYFEDEPGRAVTKVVEFSVIQNGQFCSGFIGNFEKGIGVMLNPDGGTSDTVDMLIVNSEDEGKCRVGIFCSDEFTVVDGKTLADEEAGIRYIFHFSDPLPFELYTAEKTE